MKTGETLRQLDMSEFEAEFDQNETQQSTPAAEFSAVGRRMILDSLGIVYADLGQQKLATASGSSQTQGCDLDGE